MGIIGGRIAYNFLKHTYPNGDGVRISDVDTYAARGVSKLKALFGNGIYSELRDKTIMDFGCGDGAHCVELAQNGAARVIGVDISDRLLELARKKAQLAGVENRCVFCGEWKEPVDVVLSMDAFEHFADPASILRLMHSLLKPGGYIFVEFGPIWYHPYGGHLFSVFPWAHLLFTESALIRWRSDFKSDNATCFQNGECGLNKMTVRRWEDLVAQSEFRFLSNELVPIRVVRNLHCRLTREFFTAIVRSRLISRVP